MFDVMKIARKIKEVRIARNMTQMNLAEEMDVSYQAVSSWERGNSMPDISKLEPLCDVLRISMDELLGTDSSAQVVKKIISAENVTESELTTEELQEVSSLLPPKELKSHVERAVEAQKSIDLSVLKPLAPFLDENDLLDFVERANVQSIKDVVCIAPFLNEGYLGKLALEAVEREPEHIHVIAPFLKEDTLDKLVVKLMDSGEADKIARLYPFLSRKTLRLIAEELIKEGDLKNIQSLMPFYLE